jgi:hypothetical protein
MNQSRLYLDEDSMRKSLVFVLRARNVNVLTASEAGTINRDDQDHLIVAAESARTQYTYNIATIATIAYFIRRGFLDSSLMPALWSHRNSVTRLARNFDD